MRLYLEIQNFRGLTLRGEKLKHLECYAFWNLRAKNFLPELIVIDNLYSTFSTCSTLSEIYSHLPIYLEFYQKHL